MNPADTRSDLAGDLAAELSGICGADQVISDPRTLAVLSGDAGAGARCTPALAVLPGDGAEVQDVIRACVDHGRPWVVRGAGTGMSGGCRPERGGVVIVLTRLTRILGLDLEHGQVVVEPGVTPAAIARAAAPGHFFAPLPVSAEVATVGGCVAVNAGGPRSVKYGAMRENLLGADLILPGGERVALRRGAAGLDLLSLWAGSEGSMGVAVALHLRIIGRPEGVRTVVARFDALADAARAASAIVAAGVCPAALELLDAGALAAIAVRSVAAADPPPAAALLVEVDGAIEACARDLEATVDACGSSGAHDLEIAIEVDEREALWRAHTLSYAEIRRTMGAFLLTDLSVPRSRLAPALEQIEARVRAADLGIAHHVRAGEGILHTIIGYPRDSTVAAARARELAAEAAQICLDHGGGISGEYGVGADKLDLLTRTVSAADLEIRRRVRAGFDPAVAGRPGTLSAAADRAAGRS